MEQRIVILGNGEFPRTELPKRLIECADIVICCDGAFSKLLRHGKLAENVKGKEFYITGDLDSISRKHLKEYRGHVIPYEDQNINDQTKSFRLAARLIRESGLHTELIFLGATGLREDHTIANISLMMEYASEDIVRSGMCSVKMISDYTTVIPFTESITFDCPEGSGVSIFTPDNTLSIKSDGLRWQTEGVKFSNWWQASLNRSEKKRVTLTLSHPSKAIVILSH